MTNQELKSKVVTLANRLYKEIGDRKSAFKQAWQIAKNGLELPVKGVKFGNRQEALRRLANYAPDQIKAVIVPEPENQTDHNALCVMVGVNGGKALYKLGYIPADKTAIARAVFAGKLPEIKLVSGTWYGKYGKEITTYGARISA